MTTLIQKEKRNKKKTYGKPKTVKQQKDNKKQPQTITTKVPLPISTPQ
jgi:hypothetical protein